MKCAQFLFANPTYLPHLNINRGFEIIPLAFPKLALPCLSLLLPSLHLSQEESKLVGGHAGEHGLRCCKGGHPDGVFSYSLYLVLVGNKNVLSGKLSFLM